MSIPAEGKARVRVVLAAVDPKLAECWEKFCGEFDFVAIHCGSILDCECDAVVSPANSFGFMDGGIDAAYLHHFGPQIQTRVQKVITERHGGELLVGAADVVKTDDDRIPYLIAAPTMRVPMVLGDTTVHPYLAARAVFRLIREGRFVSGSHDGERVGERIRSVAFPGLATGVGRVSPGVCARQMRRAIEDVLLGRFRFPESWAEASESHQLLYTNHPTRLQY